jgi:hypothetical protein
MNERIDKLFEQALEEFKAENKYATIIVPNPLKEKFAELIVQDLIDSMIKRYGDDDELPIQEIKLFVKEHFGVEE